MSIRSKQTKGDGKTIFYGKIVSCVFETEWLNPLSKKIIYYHDVITDSGHILNIGSVDKNSNRLKKGAVIEYIIDEKAKTKLLSSSVDANKIAEQALIDKQSKEEKEQSKTEKGRIKGQEGFLGFTWAYAKDLLIAGKTMEDMDELNKMARYIYEEIGKMLNQE
jgi:hypothetical protein